MYIYIYVHKDRRTWTLLALNEGHLYRLRLNGRSKQDLLLLAHRDLGFRVGQKRNGKRVRVERVVVHMLLNFQHPKSRKSQKTQSLGSRQHVQNCDRITDESLAFGNQDLLQPELVQI